MSVIKGRRRRRKNSIRPVWDGPINHIVASVSRKPRHELNIYDVCVLSAPNTLTIIWPPDILFWFCTVNNERHQLFVGSFLGLVYF